MRNCSNTEAREKRFQELITLLVERNYNKKTVEATINKVKELPREMVLKKRPKKQQKENNRPVFSVYDPRMPALQNIQAKHCILSLGRWFVRLFRSQSRLGKARAACRASVYPRWAPPGREGRHATIPRLSRVNIQEPVCQVCFLKV